MDCESLSFSKREKLPKMYYTSMSNRAVRYRSILLFVGVAFVLAGILLPLTQATAREVTILSRCVQFSVGQGRSGRGAVHVNEYFALKTILAFNGFNGNGLRCKAGAFPAGKRRRL